MTPSARDHLVTTQEQLAVLLGEVGDASRLKEIDYVHPHYRALIEAAPFALLATSGPEGLDVSPRGDPPGFVRVHDAHTLLLPERRGNNRGDSLRNLIGDPRVALLFMIPGVGETLRVNGRAKISIDPQLLQTFIMAGQPPKCVLVIQVETVFFQCARAILRSRLWQPVAADAKPAVPSPGTILAALSNDGIDGTGYDRELPDRQRATLY